MNEERKKVLQMLAEGKISADEAERLLEALENRISEASPATSLAETGLPKYLFVKVDSTSGDKVNIRVPMRLIQAGIKLKSLLPLDAQDKINAKLISKPLPSSAFGYGCLLCAGPGTTCGSPKTAGHFFLPSGTAR